METAFSVASEPPNFRSRSRLVSFDLPVKACFMVALAWAAIAFLGVKLAMLFIDNSGTSTTTCDRSTLVASISESTTGTSDGASAESDG